MKATVKIGEESKVFSNDLKLSSEQFIKYSEVISALQDCQFESRLHFNYWMLRLQDAASPSSRLAICRQMRSENPKPTLIRKL